MDYETILERYKRFRAVTFEINNHTLPELLSKETLETAARRIGMWARGKVVLDHVDQTAILVDYAIHDCRVGGRNAVERYVAQHPLPTGSERDTILTAMQGAFYSLFQVETLVPGVGVHVHDLFRDRRHFLADIGFSQTSAKGMVLATRVFPFEDFLMTGGAALAADAHTLECIYRLPGLPRPHKEIDNLAPEVRAELHAAIIRLCLNTNNAAQIFYQGVDDEVEAPRAELPTHRIGRNDPCPCGSGKKYKKCCGR